MQINPITSINGTLKVPGDKSISHRSIMLGSLAKGTTIVKGFLMGDDCFSTIHCFRKMGVDITLDQETVTVSGLGLYGLKNPKDVLDVGNSGTTMRLISGILSGQNFTTTITGDYSIKKRPMDRIISPLKEMNANIDSINHTGKAPLIIEPSELKPITYHSPVASAQVKSCIMLANLYTHGTTTIVEPAPSRNHSELMINHFGGNINVNDHTIICNPTDELYANEVYVPADISSAAYFMVAGLITKNSEIRLKDVCINPTRDGIIKVLKNMNGDLTLNNIRVKNGETIADIIVKSSHLTGTTVEGDVIPTMIDELPIIAVAAAYAEGTTTIKNAEELKVKESNRIDTMVDGLSKMNVNITPTEDGMVIVGGNTIKGTTVNSYDDHRVAMSLSIAALNAIGTTNILDSECVEISYPNFFEDIKQLAK